MVDGEALILQLNGYTPITIPSFMMLVYGIYLLLYFRILVWVGQVGYVIIEC